MYVSISFTKATAKGFVLIQTKEVSMRPEDVKRVFQNNADDLVEWSNKGRTSLVFLVLWNICSISLNTYVLWLLTLLSVCLR